MAEKIQINAVEMVRTIRDEHARLLAGKSAAEIVAYFSKAGEAVLEEGQQRPSTEIELQNGR